MSARIILNELLDGKTIDKTRLEEMKKQKIIAHNLRASFDQIADDLNGVMSPLQNKMMRELLKHIDELNVHIKNLDEDIDNHMKPSCLVYFGTTINETILAIRRLWV